MIYLFRKERASSSKLGIGEKKCGQGRKKGERGANLHKGPPKIK
jgi:hypothetical protein